MAKRPYKRRRILIDRFQYQLLLINLLYFFAILMIFSAALFVPLIIKLESTTLSLPEQEAVASQFLSLHARVWPALLITFFLFAIHSVFVSHRIAGPLMRFRNTFNAIAAGNLPGPVILRKNDYLSNEAVILNEMIAGLQAKIKGIETQHREVLAVFNELWGGVEAGSIEGAHQKIARLGAQVQKLGECVSQFHMPAEETTGERESGAAVVPVSASNESSSVTDS